jgi:uncharacterized membrane protein YdcZ (DUF606 family)
MKKILLLLFIILVGFCIRSQAQVYIKNLKDWKKSGLLAYFPNDIKANQQLDYYR